MIYLWCLCGSVSLAVLIAVYCMLDWGCLGGRCRTWLGRGLLEVGVGGGGDGRHRAGGAVLATNIWEKKKYNSLKQAYLLAIFSSWPTYEYGKIHFFLEF